MAEKEYIERGALLSDIGETVIFTVRGDAKLPTAEMRGANKVIDRIKSATAADVVEVRHGVWEEERWCDNFQHVCSLCHKTARVHPQSVAYKYCPYCGAKMDGKGEGEC